jgi:hypothetical protein
MLSSNGFGVSDYVYLYKSKNSEIFKKNKKKLSKRGSFKFFTMIETETENNLKDLKRFLINFKKQKLDKTNILPDRSVGPKPRAVGVLMDTNQVVHDINFLPPVPAIFDVLCLEADIIDYKYDTLSDNIYWCKTRIARSGNFIINSNSNSIEKIIKILNVSETESEFYRLLNDLNLYSINQYQLSKIERPIITSESIVKIEQKEKISEKIEAMLPKISLVCVYTSPSLFFHTLITFLKLKYPRELLELIIVDDTNSEKSMNLPEDKRIRLISTNKEAKHLPLGQKINLGVKYATSDIIVHFFDTHNYGVSNKTSLKQNVFTFLCSNSDVLISTETGIYPNKKSDCPDLGNMIYLKRFWNTCAFEDLEESSEKLVDSFLNNRSKCISGLDFNHMGYKIKDDDTLKTIVTNDFSNNVSDKLKNSLQFIFEQ